MAKAVVSLTPTHPALDLAMLESSPFLARI